MSFQKTIKSLFLITYLSFLTGCMITTPIEIAASVVEAAVDVTTGVVGGVVDLIIPGGDDCENNNEGPDDDCYIN